MAGGAWMREAMTLRQKVLKMTNEAKEKDETIAALQAEIEKLKQPPFDVPRKPGRPKKEDA